RGVADQPRRPPDGPGRRQSERPETAQPGVARSLSQCPELDFILQERRRRRPGLVVKRLTQPGHAPGRENFPQVECRADVDRHVTAPPSTNRTSPGPGHAPAACPRSAAPAPGFAGRGRSGPRPRPTKPARSSTRGARPPESAAPTGVAAAPPAPPPCPRTPC